MKARLRAAIADLRYCWIRLPGGFVLTSQANIAERELSAYEIGCEFGKPSGRPERRRHLRSV